MATNIHPELLKLYNSPNYRRKIKRAIEFAKSFHGILDGKIPRKVKFGKSNPSDKELQDFNRNNSTRLDKECLHYFAQPNDPSQERRNSRPQNSNQ
jgi:hypothetical protein